MQPASYRAAASLLFNDAAYQQAVAGGYNPVDAQRQLRTSANLIGLRAVDERAAVRLRRQANFRPEGAMVETEYSPTANTMLIVGTASDGRSAALLANATADSFLDYRSDMIANALEETRLVLERQIQEAPNRAERRALVAKRNNLEAMEALDHQQIQVAQRAVAPASPANDDTVRNGLLAGVLGALVGVGIGLFRGLEPPTRLPDPWAIGEPSATRD
jgi:hypothetical protein